MREIAIGVVALARTQLRVDLRLELDLDAPVLPVAAGVGARVTEDVVRRDVLLHFVEGLAEIVRVGERGAARVGRKRLQRFLLRRQLRELLRDAAARERIESAAAAR